MPRSPAPRLTALLAQKAPVGVIFRRGPSKLVRLVMWNRENDEFLPAQWFKGKIYPDCSDISPDGRHLIYFAMGGVSWAIAETDGAWTAISVLPSLTAIALWGQGDTRGGGGMFISDHSYWLYADANTFLIRDNSGLQRETYGPHLAYRSRMERDGWVQEKRPKPKMQHIFKKRIGDGWILRQLGFDGGYELENRQQEKLPFPVWEWAEWDRGRLVWADSGCLHAATLGSHTLGDVRTLCDFNGMTPKSGREEPGG